jgi:hydrogenase-4 component D
MLFLFSILVILPIAGAVGAILLSDKISNRWAILIASLTVLVALLIIFKTFPDKTEDVLFTLPWIELPQKLFGFLMDPLSSLMLLVITIIGVLVVLYSTEYLSSRNKDHPVARKKNKYHF